LFTTIGTGFLSILLEPIHNRHWFLIDSARANPYKLVYRVTRFERQHKVPIRRSAFTYCEDEIPSGLNLGKTKYGGPFTTEEVENVKAFYGILKILFALGFIFFLDYTSGRFSSLWSENHTVKNGALFEYFHKKILFLLPS